MAGADQVELVRRTAFALLVRDGRPVAADALATATDEVDPKHVAEAIDELAANGLIDRSPAGAVVGAGGLTLAAAPHGLLLRGRDYRTWCAYDAIGIAAALRETAAISTRCGVCERAIALPLPDGATGDRPERLWLAAGGSRMREDFCAPTVLLCSAEHAATWSERQAGRGRIIDLGTASRLGAGAWSVYAREVERLGAA
ncbi:MAG TPA: organomercurial lyase [Candidatus Limnocylindria bacterium]|nr:organomercurial lyase [Candidatus Limnocylindria bacterium]